MDEFPKLKTGARAQYGCVRFMEGAMTEKRYLDGRTRRFPTRAPARKWRLDLKDLNEQECTRLAEFLRVHVETGEPFRFVDPWDGVAHEGCVVRDPEHVLRAAGEGRWAIRVWVEKAA